MTSLDAVEHDACGQQPADHDVPWERLNGRLIWVNLVRLLLSLLPTGLSMLIFGAGRRMPDLWPAMVATGFGVFISVSDVVRWLRTRYRVTADLVEIKTGRVMRVYRQIPRERIRAVDHKAKLRHRVAGLRVVLISSGRTRPALKLDAVSKEMAEALRRELMRGKADAEAEAEAQGAAAQETLISQVRWFWIFYNAINIWGVLVGGLMLWSLDSLLDLFTVDLIGALDRVIGRLVPEGPGTYLLWVAIAAVLGTGTLTSGFIKENWHFRLVRRVKEDGTELVTRQGLLSTREVHRDDRRLRGVHLSEPLFWRWIRLTETTVISTGLANWSLSSEPASSILPRGPVGEARRVAALVLPGDVRPLEAPLRRHPSAALYRRLLWAAAFCAVTAGLLAWLGATRAVPAWIWVIPLWAFPVTAGLALIAFRALGHTFVGQYLVMRHGLSRRQTAALQREAVLGLKVRQSLVQRWLGLVSVGVPTAAGLRFYQAPDMRVEQFMTFAGESVPELIAEFLQSAPDEKAEISAPRRLPDRRLDEE
ncbi:putative membrane protein [Streptomyces sp. 2112.3]|uniref:PH domain-containing protein n=1 Tax=Streptomyces sp. 2112.3 TaxID=1881023 RepID=UPI00089BFE2D|nr:PH domain-containing protein [Streptomyces sp. 2112.3]SEE65245.1 putative membrane protein [Streptomyces sp. 2112.3]